MLRQTFLYLSRSKKAQRLLLSLPGAQGAARQFVAGETLAQAVEAVRALEARGMLATLDHLGENVASIEQARAARDEYIEVLNEIKRQKLRSTISVKLTQLGMDLSEDACRENLRALVECAEQIGDFVEVDMEGSAYTDRTLHVICAVHEQHAAIGAVIQGYLYRSEKDIEQLLLHGVSVRLCKGAYNEPSSLAFPNKSDVDTNYVKLTRILLGSKLYHRIATHDPRMVEAARQAANELGLSKNDFEFQMLYGVNRPLQDKLIQDGYRVRIYVPFGGAWFPYFMRRLAERPANAWFALRSVLRTPLRSASL